MVTCPLCGRSVTSHSALSGDMVHAGVLERIRADRPDWSPPMPVCTPCLRKYRAAYVEHVLAQDRGELSALEAEVVTSLREHDLLARDVDARFEERASVGQRLADRVATFGGSWTFLVGFGVVLCLWVALNSVRLFQPFDPYPFILLNLVLSCIAALQAPIIMMSQNRQEAKDRLRSENDYRINLKAELEIRHLQAKLDQLLTRQWQRLIEIQQLQTAMIEDLQKHRRAE